MTAPATAGFTTELRKVPAFFRRDLLVTFSYRLAFFADWISLIVQMVTFALVGQIVDSGSLPEFDGQPTEYLEFVAVGIAITAFLQVGLGRVVTTIRGEQLMGTLEALLLTPTSTLVLQLGVVAYDLIYVPLRTAAFILLAVGLFGVEVDLLGLGPVLALLLLFIPFVWGLGVASAAAVLAFRRGSAVTGFAVIGLSLTSGAYFPLDVLPGWAQRLADLNPLTITLEAAREALLGSAGWADVIGDALVLAPLAVVSLLVGFGAFHGALVYERRRGSLGLY